MKYKWRIIGLLLVVFGVPSCKKIEISTQNSITQEETTPELVLKEPIYFWNMKPLRNKPNFDSLDVLSLNQIDVIKDSLRQINEFGVYHSRGIVSLITKSYLDSIAIAESDTMKFLFIGDVMGHDPQIEAARKRDGQYDYSSVFRPIQTLVNKVDFAIANLEVPLAGEPYTGYPKFSSPDQLAADLKSAGIDILMTANNHTCDKGKGGIIRTVKVLDSLGMRHTGSWKDTASWQEQRVLILEKQSFKVGILNYTYGTNYLPAPPPTFVNLIDTARIAKDIKYCDSLKLDELIVFLHWGKEYELKQSADQAELAAWIFQKGVKIVIGAHPHVVQPMQMIPGQKGDKLVVYSLGNFVSDQRTSPRDGGAVFELSLVKISNKVHIADRGYHLTWVHKFLESNKMQYEVLICSQSESENYKSLNDYSRGKMKEYMNLMRSHLKDNNLGVPEILLDSLGNRK